MQATPCFSKVEERSLVYKSMHVDEQNTLWIGAENGLYKWRDGLSSLVWLRSGMNITSINSLGAYLILGTSSGEIHLYNKNLNSSKEVASQSWPISQIVSFKNNKLFIATKGNGYYEITPFRLIHHKQKSMLTNDWIYDMCTDLEDKLWIASEQGLYCLYESILPNKMKAYVRFDFDSLTCLYTIDSFVYAGTSGGRVYKVNIYNDSTTLLLHPQAELSRINDLLVLDHSFVIASRTGVYLVDKQTGLSQQLSNSNIDKLCLDNEGIIWYCGQKLLGSSLGEQFELLTNKNAAISMNINCMDIDSNNLIWYAANNLIYIYNPISGQTKQTKYQINGISVMNFDNDNSLWIGTSNSGLYRIDTAKQMLEKVTVDPNEANSGVLSLNVQEHQLFVANLNGLWKTELPNANFSFLSLGSVSMHDQLHAYDLKKNQKQELWVATNGKGILKIHDQSVTEISKNLQLPSTVFIDIEEDAKKQYWFNAFQNGLYLFRNDSLLHLSEKNGLSSNQVYSMKAANNDLLMVATSKGIDQVNIHNFSTITYPYDLIASNFIPQLKSMSVTKEGQVFIGTTNGLLKVNIPSYRKQLSQQIAIENISVMEKFSPIDKHIFKADENYFKFKISTGSNMHQTIYFRYQLKGLSRQWNQSIDHEVVFPRLNPGNYVFIAEASNNRNFLNASVTSYAFKITKPFWNTWLFKGLIAISMILGIYYYILFREKRISRVQQLEKEKAIAEFETLKQQVSPHFLFNSFNTLIQIIDEDANQAIEYTQKLSDFYRSLISYRDVDLVSLEEEIKLLQNYFYLQKMRFGDSLNLKIDENLLRFYHTQIPPLTLQILAENAIKHNIISVTKPLLLSLTQQNGLIIVSNNINVKLSVAEGEQMGLQNIINRFKLFSKQEVKCNHGNEQFDVFLPILLFAK